MLTDSVKTAFNLLLGALDRSDSPNSGSLTQIIDQLFKIAQKEEAMQEYRYFLRSIESELTWEEDQLDQAYYIQQEEQINLRKWIEF